MSVEMSFNCKECDTNITFTDGIREMERIGFLKLICKNKHINRYFRGDSIAMKDRQNSKDRLLDKLQKEIKELKKAFEIGSIKYRKEVMINDYIEHRRSCAISPKCTCGLGKLLKTRGRV